MQTPEAWEAFAKLFVKDTEKAPKLQSAMTNTQYLDAISAPKVEVTAAGDPAPLQNPDVEIAAEINNMEVVPDDTSDHSS